MHLFCINIERAAKRSLQMQIFEQGTFVCFLLLFVCLFWGCCFVVVVVCLLFFVVFWGGVGGLVGW